MVDLSAIGVVATSLNTLVNMTKAMKDVHDATLFDSKVFELQRAILETQQSVFAANEERTALIQSVSDLEKEIARMKTWETEKQRYELEDFGIGSVCYVVKEEMRGREPSHRICANCYSADKKSFLQKHGFSSYVDKMKCNVCGDEINRDKPGGGAPAPTLRMNRS